MASSPLFITSEGEDFEVQQVSRQSGSTRVSAMKVSGTDASFTAGPLAANGLPGLQVTSTGKVLLNGGHSSTTPGCERWDKAAADGAAATATAEHAIFRAMAALTVAAVRYLPDAAATANDTSYFTINLFRRNADGTNQVQVAQINCAITVAPFSGNFVQWQAVPLTLTAANLVLATGQILTVSITKTGSGLVCPAGELQVDYTLN